MLLKGSPSAAGAADQGWIFSSIYTASFFPLMALTATLAWMTRPKAGKEAVVPGFAEHQFRYLFVWALAIGADWLQGPYVYALYASYGFSSSEIAQLFVVGFMASMVFGTVVGAVADAWGRKCCAVIYCVCYVLSCITKHSNVYQVLLCGRILGGIATSLLSSTFECWMVAEHRRRGFSEALLRHMFGLMFFVQYLAAIAAGLVAQVAANTHPLSKISGFSTLHFGGYTAPFDLSLCLLLVCIPVILLTWTENYGDSSATQKSSLVDSFAMAGRALVSGWRVPLLGVVVTAFEGCMFAFVFNWTPALSSKDPDAPHGLIFSAFMMACMCGSSLFTIVSATMKPSKVLLPVCLVATMSLGLVTMALGGDEPNTAIIFFGFLAFEACVGIYFPAIGSLKSEVVPEDARAGVYNAYRVPLNAVVVVLLLANFSLRASFGVCCGLLMLAVAAARVVLRGS
mmetsp:Transcript_22959/g.60657  ORF Transcript_22959/g.60657 Transcript_22959/m.60657 type:complete len:456 (-) Transcript_22959:5-1372(-)